jgi:hypothetical protein
MSIRLLASETACGVNVGAASTFTNATDVRLVNSGTTVRLVTVANTADVTLATLSLAGGESVVLRKDATDQIFAAHAEILGVGCATKG